MTPNDWQDALRSLLSDDYTPQEEPLTAPDAPKPKPKLTVTLDRKRAGKTATIISGFDPDDARCGQLAAELKRLLATGGSSRGGEILVQGDRVAQVRKILKERGFLSK